VFACTHTAAADSSVPSIADVTTISLRQEQGGPSQRRCDGVVYEVTVDLASGTWTSAWCMPPEGKNPANVPRTSKHGKLAADDRAKIVGAYGRLTAMPAPGCGNDGGTLTLTVAKTDKSNVKFVDENWGCRKPPPMIAKGIADLAKVMTMIAPP
jgi:hypothetical protein